MSCLKFSTFSEKHEANKNKYGLTKELFSTRMTKTTHSCSAVQLINSLIDHDTVASEAQRKAQHIALKITVYEILLWEANGVRTSPCKGPRFGPRLSFQQPCSQCRIIPTLTQRLKCLQGPGNGDLQNKFSTLCYISRLNGLQKYMLIADTILSEPGPEPVLRFGGIKLHFQSGKIFVFVICSKQIFLSTTKFGRYKKIWGCLSQNYPPCPSAWAEPTPENPPFGGFLCVQGARHSEYLFLIHDMNNICRFCKLIINILPQRPLLGSCFPTKIVSTSLT